MMLSADMATNNVEVGRKGGSAFITMKSSSSLCAFIVVNRWACSFCAHLDSHVLHQHIYVYVVMIIYSVTSEHLMKEAKQMMDLFVTL